MVGDHEVARVGRPTTDYKIVGRPWESSIRPCISCCFNSHGLTTLTCFESYHTATGSILYIKDHNKVLAIHSAIGKNIDLNIHNNLSMIVHYYTTMTQNSLSTHKFNKKCYCNSCLPI